MIDYVYRAKDLNTGQVIKAEVKADSPESAAKLLMRQNLFALDIHVKGEEDILRRFGLNKHVSLKDKVIFSRQLSTLLNAGLPLTRALRTTSDQIKNPELKSVIDSVIASVEGGTSLSDAFAQYPKVFNEIYVALVAAGEASGTLDKTLLRLATQQEKEAAILSKVRSALIYPAIAFVLIILVLVFMLNTIVPEVAKLYSSLHKDLPFLTQILLWLSNAMRTYWYLFILVFIGLFFATRKAIQTEKVQLWLDKVKLSIPIIGKLMAKVYMARFARTMHTLIASGVPLLKALETTRNAIANKLIEHDIDYSIDKVRGGKALSESLEKSKNILPLVPQMVKVGEESGALDDMMERVAVYYEDEVDEEIKNLSTTIEPLIMIVLGGLVAFVLGAVLYPIYSLVGSGDLQNLK